MCVCVCVCVRLCVDKQQCTTNSYKPHPSGSIFKTSKHKSSFTVISLYLSPGSGSPYSSRYGSYSALIQYYCVSLYLSPGSGSPYSSRYGSYYALIQYYCVSLYLSPGSGSPYSSRYGSYYAILLCELVPQPRIRLSILIQVWRGDGASLHIAQVRGIQENHICLQNPQRHPHPYTTAVCVCVCVCVVCVCVCVCV